MLDGFVYIAAQEQDPSNPTLHVGVVRSKFRGTSEQLAGSLLIATLAGLTRFVRQADRFVGRMLNEAGQPTAAGEQSAGHQQSRDGWPRSEFSARSEPSDRTVRRPEGCVDLRSRSHRSIHNGGATVTGAAKQRGVRQGNGKRQDPGGLNRESRPNSIKR